MFDLESYWREVGSASWPSMMLCLFTSNCLPDCCAEMSRDPQLDTGAVFGEDFLHVYARAIAQNAAAHDGAIMIGRPTAAQQYRVMGWSYRLFPPHTVQSAEPNRGSAFNSCLEMSKVAAVDMTYLVSEGRLVCFVKGGATLIEL